MVVREHLSEREAKLPVWVQDELIQLRRKLYEAEQAAEQALLATDPQGSDAVIRRFGENADIGLGRNITVMFQLGDRWHETLDARVDRDNKWLIIHGGDQIVLRPQSGNSIKIGLTR